MDSQSGIKFERTQLAWTSLWRRFSSLPHGLLRDDTILHSVQEHSRRIHLTPNLLIYWSCACCALSELDPIQVDFHFCGWFYARCYTEIRRFFIIEEIKNIHLRQYVSSHTAVIMGKGLLHKPLKTPTNAPVYYWRRWLKDRSRKTIDTSHQCPLSVLMIGPHLMTSRVD